MHLLLEHYFVFRKPNRKNLPENKNISGLDFIKNRIIYLGKK